MISWKPRLIAAAVGVFFLAGHPFFSASAAEYAEAVVRSAVQTWVRGVTADRRPEVEIDSVEPYTRNGVTAAYVIHFINGGYCIAGADSLVLPVYLYCPKGTYDLASPSCQAILQEIADRLDFLKALPAGDPLLDRYRADLESRAALWESLAAGGHASGPRAQSISSLSSLELPLASQWNQSSPYNDVCPSVPFAPPNMDTNAVVGCVATAMAQVMNYWRWPNTGVGTASGTYRYCWTNAVLSTPLGKDPQIMPGWGGGRLGWSSGTLWLTGTWDESVLEAAAAITNDSGYASALNSLYGSMVSQQTALSANFGATTYDWSILRDTHSDPVDAGDTEVARLSFHAGLAVRMDYGLLGSSAFVTDIPGALSQHFRYDSDAVVDSADINRMVDEIRWQRPVLLGGYDNNRNGHRWVVFGYNHGTSPAQFKMNLGWGGGSDGWYSLDTVPQGLTNKQNHVTRIAPFGVVRFVGASISGDGSPGSPYQDIEEAAANAANNTTLVFKADSFNTFSAPQLVVNRPLTLNGINSTLGK